MTPEAHVPGEPRLKIQRKGDGRRGMALAEESKEGSVLHRVKDLAVAIGLEPREPGKGEQVDLMVGKPARVRRSVHRRFQATGGCQWLSTLSW